MRDEAQSLYGLIASAVSEVLPPGWIQAQVEAQMVNGRLKVYTAVVDHGAAAKPCLNPARIPLASSGVLEFTQLRELMASDPQGPWDRATLTLFSNGAFDCAFSYRSMACVA
jgi:hypothetical protein